MNISDIENYIHPQSLKTVKEWFPEAGLADAIVQYGPNGIVDRGKKTDMPLCTLQVTYLPLRFWR